MFHALGRNNRLLMLALFAWALGEGLWYINFRQLYLVQLGATEAQVGLALAVEMLVRSLLTVPAGYLADRIGPHRVMVASWFVGVLGTVLGALATTWQGFIPGLAIYAMSGFAMPSLSAYAIQSLPERSRAGAADRVLAAVFAAYTAGLIISPSLGGLIADSWGIRSSLWISSGVFVISTLIVLFTHAVPVEETVHVERPAALLRNQGFTRLSVYYVLVFGAMFVGYQLMPNFLRDVRGLTYSQIGVLFSIAAGGTVVLNMLVSRLNPRWSFAAALLAYGLAVLGVWQLRQPVLLGGAFAITGTLTVVRTLALARTSDVVSPHNRGLAFGIVETIYSVAAAAAAGVAGAVYRLTPGHGLPFIIALAAIPPLVGLWFAVRRRLPAAAAASEAPLAPLAEQISG